jgi:hypothetical protein
MIGACIAAGLVAGEGFVVDASLIVADANKQRSIPARDDKNRDPEAAGFAVKEYPRNPRKWLDLSYRSDRRGHVHPFVSRPALIARQDRIVNHRPGR